MHRLGIVAQIMVMNPRISTEGQHKGSGDVPYGEIRQGEITISVNRLKDFSEILSTFTL